MINNTSRLTQSIEKWQTIEQLFTNLERNNLLSSLGKRFKGATVIQKVEKEYQKLLDISERCRKREAEKLLIGGGGVPPGEAILWYLEDEGYLNFHARLLLDERATNFIDN